MKGLAILELFLNKRFKKVPETNLEITLMNVIELLNSREC